MSLLTGSYTTSDWDRLTKTWKIKAYLTHPGTEEPMDVDSATLSANRAGFLMPGEKTWDEVMEDVLEEYAEAWDRLAV